jgi:hypothetical protein
MRLVCSGSLELEVRWGIERWEGGKVEGVLTSGRRRRQRTESGGERSSGSRLEFAMVVAHW